MSSCITNPSKDPAPAPTIPQTKNTSMTYEEMRKIYPNLPAILPPPIRSVECNKMVYCDSKGVKRQIWMPKGTARTASKHLHNKDWDALAKWPIWDNQKYAHEGEAEEKERKEWEWLVVEEPEEGN